MDSKNDELSVRVLTEYKKFAKNIERLKSCVVLNTAHADVVSLSKKKIVFVLDTSDSMSDHMSVLKQVMEKVVSCALGNTIGVVAFDDKARVICPLRELTSTDKMRTIKEELHKLKAQGFTNMYDGLETGMKVLWENPTVDERRFLVLFTDGAANIYPRKTNDILTRLKMIPFSHRTDIYPIALGTNVNQDLLLKLAENHNGRLYDLKSPSDLFQSFGDCMGSILSVLMTNVEVKITTDCLLIVNGIYRLIQPCVIELGTLFVNDTRDILLTFEHVDTTTPVFASIEVTYMDDKKRRKTICKELRLETKNDMVDNDYIRQQELRLEVSAMLEKLYQAQTMLDVSKQQLETKIKAMRDEIFQHKWDENPLCNEILAILNQLQQLDSFRCRSLSMGLKSQRQTSLDKSVPEHVTVSLDSESPCTLVPSHVTSFQHELAIEFKETTRKHEDDVGKSYTDDSMTSLSADCPKRQITITDESCKKARPIQSRKTLQTPEDNQSSSSYCLIN